jgi:hypothetical protein
MNKNKLFTILAILALSLALLPLVIAEENDSSEECTIEGEISNPSLGPGYYAPCCDGLKYYSLAEPGVDGIGGVCFDPEKGSPVCMNEGTDEEGYYYPDGELLLLEDCEEDSGEAGIITRITTAYQNKYRINKDTIKKDKSGNLVRVREGNNMGVDKSEIVASKKEVEPLMSTHGAKVRFLQLEKNVVKAIEGQKLVIDKLEEQNEINLTDLVEFNSGLVDLLTKIRSVDFDNLTNNESLDLFLEYKFVAKDLIAAFREKAHSLLSDEEILELRSNIVEIDNDELKELNNKLVDEKRNYNALVVSEKLSKFGINDSNFVKAVQSGELEFNKMKEQLKNKYDELAPKLKQEAALKLREAKTSMNIKAHQAMQNIGLNITNMNVTANKRVNKNGSVDKRVNKNGSEGVRYDKNSPNNMR